MSMGRSRDPSFTSILPPAISPPLATGWPDVRIDGLRYCLPWFWNECRKLWLCLVRVKATSAVGWFHPLDNVVPVSVLPTDIQYVPGFSSALIVWELEE